jgi:hypothetical protein
MGRMYVNVVSLLAFFSLTDGKYALFMLFIDYTSRKKESYKEKNEKKRKQHALFIYNWYDSSLPSACQLTLSFYNKLRNASIGFFFLSRKKNPH